MARGRGRHPHGGRLTPKRSRPRHGAPGAHRSRLGEEPDLLVTVRQALRSNQPLELLTKVSALVAAIDPRSSPLLARAREAVVHPPTIEGLAESFLAVDRPEMSALLAVIAQIGLDEGPLRQRVEREVAHRVHPLPRWLDELASAEVIGVIEMSHLLRDGENVMLGVRLVGGHELTFVVYIDHNQGTLVKDAFVVPRTLDAVVALMRSRMEDPDTTWRDLSPADARARITAAIELATQWFPPIETDTWPACRPLVEWVCRKLPAGGTGYVRPDWSDERRAELVERFFASAFGSRWDAPDRRELLDSFVRFATACGPGDPMRWSPTAVEILLVDWLPRKVVAPASHLAKAPDLLRAFIRFCHAERAVPAHLTDDTLTAVDDFEPDFLGLIGRDGPLGPASLLGGLDGSEVATRCSSPPDGPGGGCHVAGTMLERLSRDVGGEQALSQLDDRPLPDEPFVWDGIAPDIHDAVRSVLALCDRCCDELLDLEYRTACRRLLRRIAIGDPAVFRRRGRVDTAAAALCWLIGHGNDLFRQRTVKELMSWFGGSGSTPSQRAATLARAAGLEQGDGERSLGSADLLVSSFRRKIIDLRDRYRDEPT